MKKKFFATVLCCVTACSMISAQENVSAFSHLSVGLELFSTTGFGLELATPLSPHFAFRGGISLLPISYSTSFEIVSIDGGLKENINNAINSDPEIASILTQNGLPTRAEDINTNFNTTATLGLVNGKILVDYYPWAKSSFHLTAGVYIGATQLIKMKGRMDQAVDVLNVLKDNGHNFFEDVYYDDNENGYHLTGNDVSNINGAITINAIKPYFGLGIGRAVPKSRVGICFEIGAFYQNTPKLTSDNHNIQQYIDNQLSGISDVLNKLPVYPVVSLKLNFRVF